MTNFYRPSFASAEDIFVSPPEHRPYIDLSIVSDVASLPIHLRKLNSGATRWANFVIGIAVDGAIAEGVEPERIREVFNLGCVTAFAEVVFDPASLQRELELSADDAMVAYCGTVELSVHNLGGDLVHVTGGIPSQSLPPDASMVFARRDGVYVPHRGYYGVPGKQFSEQVDYAPAPRAYDPSVSKNQYYVPEEFIPPEILGKLEENVTAGIQFSVHNGGLNF